jgi:hypothetical protein
MAKKDNSLANDLQVRVDAKRTKGPRHIAVKRKAESNGRKHNVLETGKAPNEGRKEEEILKPVHRTEASVYRSPTGSSRAYGISRIGEKGARGV